MKHKVDIVMPNEYVEMNDSETGLIGGFDDTPIDKTTIGFIGAGAGVTTMGVGAFIYQDSQEVGNIAQGQANGQAYRGAVGRALMGLGFAMTLAGIACSVSKMYDDEDC